jgi:DNA-binding beta-propeller fold protein YncE
MTTVGRGAYTYEIVEDWAKLPKGWEMGQAEPATDSEDRVYVFNRSDHPLMVFDREGNFIREWGQGVLTDAHGIYISPDDYIYLPVRDAHAVVKYTLDGRPLLTLGMWDKPSDTGGARPDGTVRRAAGPFNRCTDLGISPSGDLYISDGYANCRVHKFSPEGRYLFSWGRPGKNAPGEFHIPHGIWVHWDGRVLVADRENNHIQIFTAEGNYITQWTGLARPCDIFIDANEIVYVVELDAFMTILDMNGQMLAKIDAATGHGGHAVWGDSCGDLYIGHNMAGKRLLKLVRQSQQSREQPRSPGVYVREGV